MSKLIPCLIIVLLVATAASAQVQRTVMEQTPRGTTLNVEHTQGTFERPSQSPLRDDYLVAQQVIAGLIYNSCAIGPDGYYAGTENGGVNLPAVIQNLNFDGSVAWSYEAHAAYLAFASHGAALAMNPSIDGTTVLGNWDGDAWGWSYDFPSTSPGCIVSTADGSVVVVGVNKTTNGSIYCFDGFTGELLSSYELPGNGMTRVMDITTDGSLVASRGNMLHVLDTATGVPLYNAGAGASCDVVAISPDGHWLVAGWTNMEVFERVDDSYVYRWGYRRVPGAYASYARVNSAGDIICGINTGAWNRTYVYMVNANDASHVGILYEGPVSGGVVQEGVRDIFFGDESNLAVVGNWGDDVGATPEVMVFEFGDRTPVATLDTRGSIYAVNGFVDSNGGLEIVACGKQTHANVMGNGGDYYIMYIPGIVSNEEVDETPENVVFQTALRGAYPNPFNPMTRVRFSLDRAQHVKLSVFDLTGKRIAELADGVFPGGEQSILWNGKDSTGRDMPSGNYMVQMETDQQMRSSKMTLLR